ncbi:MAG: efflux RND transporter periplasmic adaptor subunit [Chloroflexi bacterium]|nr:efflux RND transporter periplasmic adaptor subunit [Chloroflexota bacterium]
MKMEAPKSTALRLRPEWVRRRWFVALVIIALVGLAGYLGYQRMAAPTAVTGQVITVPVRKGSLISTVSATGSVVADKQAKLTFTSASRLKELKAKMGDEVKAGQPLAALDTTQLEINLAQAKAALRISQIKLEQTKAPEAIAAAQAAYDSAMAKYNALVASPTAADLKAAEQSVASAQANLQNAEANLAELKASPSPDDIRKAELNLEQAKNNLWAVQVNRDGIKGDPRNPDYKKVAADAQVAAAETSVAQAQLNLEVVKSGPKPEDLATAEKNVQSAQAALAAVQARLDQLKAGPTAADLATAKSAIANAKVQLVELTQGSVPTDIALAEEQVKQSEAAVKQAELNLANATIVAPFDGVVAAVGANVGEQVSSATPIVTLVDPKAVRVDATVDENDVAKLGLGKSAQITFDALPGKRFSGKVTAIAPSGTMQQGVVTYLVSISLDSAGTNLPIGMTANVSITVDQRDNVLMVPNRAIRIQGRERIVEVLVNGQPEKRAIRVGLSNDQFTEVVEGLKEGEEVVLPTTTTAPVRVPGMGGFGGFGGSPMPVGPPR